MKQECLEVAWLCASQGEACACESWAEGCGRPGICWTDPVRSSREFREISQNFATCLICSEFVCRPFHEMETRRLAEAPACCVVMILMWLLSTLRSCIDSTKQYATIVVTTLQIHTRCVTYRNHIGWKDLQSPYKIKKLELRWISLYLETQCSGIQRDDDYNPKHLM